MYFNCSWSGVSLHRPSPGAELRDGGHGVQHPVVRVLGQLVGCRATCPLGHVTSWPWPPFGDSWIPLGVTDWAVKL